MPRKSMANPQLATARKLAELIRTCPSCKRHLDRHEYAQLATCAVPDEKTDTLQVFFQAIKNHEWATLGKFQTWNPRGEDVEVYAVRCITDGGSVVAVKTHFELFQSDRLLFCESLSAEDGGKLFAALPSLDWHPF